jgi:hypothetical protein
MNDDNGFDHRFGHQDGKSQEMQANQGFRQEAPARTSQRSPLNTSRKL